MSKMFRLLRADEIDVRVQAVRQNGISLLLYKNARCDMNILDETVTPMRWKREHTRNNANCIVSIYDEQIEQWITKEDTGTESPTEAQKGMASDSFKRACVNWGIGRELYTSPFIWIDAKDTKIERNDSGKLTVKDTFYVNAIEYKDESISYLEIYSRNSQKQVFSYGTKIVVDVGQNRINTFNAFAANHNMSAQQMKTFRQNLITCGAISEKSPLDMTNEEFNKMMVAMEASVR